MNRILKQSFLALLAGITVLGGSPLHAKNLYTYDLDSMTYASTDIVEGNVVEWHSYDGDAQSPQVMDFKVTGALKGEFKPGDVFPLETMDWYTRAKNGAASVRLKPGDHLVVFCARPRHTVIYGTPPDAVVYMPAPGGVQFVQGGRAYPYRQINNPGLYLAMTPDDGFKDAGTPLKTLRSQIAASKRVAVHYHELLASPKTASDPATLLRLLKGRCSADRRYGLRDRDQMGVDIAQKISDLKDPAAIDSALQITAGIYDVSLLSRGFNTPQGREYLLAHVADPHVALADRIRLAQALPDAISPLGERTGPDAHYASRIAQTAAESTPASLTVALIDSVQRLAITVAQVRPLQKSLAAMITQTRLQQEPTDPDTDLDQAVATLTKLYTATSSDRVKSAIEETCAATEKPEQYDSLHSPCGPVLSTVEQPVIYNGGKSGKQLKMSIRIEPVNHADLSQLTCLLAFENTSSHKEATEPAGIPGLDNMTIGRLEGEQTFDIPQGIGHGQYHVFLEFLNADGAVVSRGWGSTLSL